MNIDKLEVLLRLIRRRIGAVETVGVMIRNRQVSILDLVCNKLDQNRKSSMEYILNADPDIAMHYEDEIAQEGSSMKIDLLLRIYRDITLRILAADGCLRAKQLRDVLKDIQRDATKKGVRLGGGICRQVRERIDNGETFGDLLLYFFRSWPKYSGQASYPVCVDGKSGKEAWSFYSNCWDLDTEYGRLRHELVAHMIHELRILMNDEYGKTGKGKKMMTPQVYAYTAQFIKDEDPLIGGNDLRLITDILTREAANRLADGGFEHAFITDREGKEVFNTSNSPAFIFARSASLQLEVFDIKHKVEMVTHLSRKTLGIRIDPRAVAHVTLAKSVIMTIAAVTCHRYGITLPGGMSETRESTRDDILLFHIPLYITED